MRDSQIEIRDFIVDWNCVQSGFILISVEALIIAIIIGVYNNSFGIGVIALFVSELIFVIPLLGGVCMLTFSLFWSIMIGLIPAVRISPLTAWIIGIIAFFIILFFHMAAIAMKEGVLCYSYLLFEALAASILFYAGFKSVPLSAGILIALVICAFVPIVRHIEGVCLSVCTGYIIFTLAHDNLSLTASIIIGSFVFILSEGVYLLMNSIFSWSDIIAQSKLKKMIKAENIEMDKIKSSVYTKYPDLEKEYFYFCKCVCKDEMDKIKFENDWKKYLHFIYDSPKMVEFNQWYEDNALYKNPWSDYNKDYAKHYGENREKQKRTDESTEAGNNADSKKESLWFIGINNIDDLKKRYKDLLKIYHPDNRAGDTSITQQIQREYERILLENSWN